MRTWVGGSPGDEQGADRLASMNDSAGLNQKKIEKTAKIWYNKHNRVFAVFNRAHAPANTLIGSVY